MSYMLGAIIKLYSKILIIYFFFPHFPVGDLMSPLRYHGL